MEDGRARGKGRAKWWTANGRAIKHSAAEPQPKSTDRRGEFLDRMNRIYRMPTQTVPLRILSILFILSKVP